MRRRVLVFALFTLSLPVAAGAGCGATDGDKPTDDRGSGSGGETSGEAGNAGVGGSESTGAGGAASCTPGLASGFELAPTPYGVPPPRCQSRFDAFAGYGSLDYGLFDLTYDGRGDLVVTSDACDESVGATHWDVYAAGASAFAAKPVAYGVPAPRCGARFDDEAHVGAVDWALLDLTADGRGDLVVFSDDCDPDVGKLRWDVYAGGDGAFAAKPVAYSIPAPRCQTHFDAASNLGPLGYALLDLVGDGRPDFVVTHDACDPDVGTERWDVYAGGQSGFGAATSFTIPAPRCQVPFDSTAHASSSVSYALIGLTSARPELVVTRDDCDPSVGQTRWDVYDSGDAGFDAAPVGYAIPAPRCLTRFDETAIEKPVRYGLLDLGCDQRADIVVASDGCDGEVGTQRWDVYAGGSTGFVASPTALTLPAPRCQVPFDAFARANTSGSVSFGLSGFLGGKPALVVTSDPCDTTVGGDHWDRYALP